METTGDATNKASITYNAAAREEMVARTFPRAEPIGTAAEPRDEEVPSSRGRSPSAQRAAEPREEMVARTFPRAEPIG
ncbi:MAG: hypothetical protein WAV47_05265, partial [Blastocatellia bacterium]